MSISKETAQRLVASVNFPAVFRELFEPRRLKVYYGGRASGKSWQFAIALLILGAQRPLKILCAREVQDSISASVHSVLAYQIEALGLGDHYEVFNNSIVGRGKAEGTEFTFTGLKHKINSLKSTEGIDIVWVEEATDVSKASWDVLFPTIRKPGSEIWVSFNPDLASDETYKRFVLELEENGFVDLGPREELPPDTKLVPAVVRHVNYHMLPEGFLSQEVLDMAASSKLKDFNEYMSIWEGFPKATVEGAVYAKELTAATLAGRITRVPHVEGRPVHTFFDIGKSDSTAVWFAQIVGFEFRIIDYYENRQESTAHYAKMLRGKPYMLGTVWLPHDAESDTIALTEGTMAEQMRVAGFDVKIVKRIGLENGIDQARLVFGKCWFDEKLCTRGLSALRHYKYATKKDGESLSAKPTHDRWSHGADAFRYLAVALREGADGVRKKTPKADNRWVV